MFVGAHGVRPVMKRNIYWGQVSAPALLSSLPWRVKQKKKTYPFFLKSPASTPAGKASARTRCSATIPPATGIASVYEK